MTSPLQGQSAIVTGAGSGINLEFARILLSKGCNVLFADLALRPEAEEVLEQYAPTSKETSILKNSGESTEPKAAAVFQQTDVTNWAQLERMFTVAEEAFGGIDIVCPGAGVFEPDWSTFWYPPDNAPSRDSTSASRYALFDINLMHPIRTTQLAIAYFLAHPSETIPAHTRTVMHVSSVAGQVTPMLAPLYNASKHALSGFVRSLAPLDAALGVRVVAVAPGVVRTPLWELQREKLALVRESEGDVWITPAAVGSVMAAICEGTAIEVPAKGGQGVGTAKVDVRGGMVVEVSQGVRIVEQFNDPGPSSGGNSVAGMIDANRAILDRLKGGGWGIQAKHSL